jgi:hypothetical protein
MKFQGRPCPTVTIMTEAGPCVINKSDYEADPSKWELYEPETKVEKSEEKIPEETEESKASLKRRVKKRVKPDSN